MINYVSIDNIGSLEQKDKPWKVQASSTARSTRNFIREIVENLDLCPNPEKALIALSIGDPTVYGNLPTSTEAIEAVVEAAQSSRYNGYAACSGFEEARAAVAEYISANNVPANPKDISLCSGCSSSLQMSIEVLADGCKNQNILIPRPGFPLYRTLAESVRIGVKYYNLLPERNFEVDLKDLQLQIDENTAAIVVNNPSNPCGSVYSKEHLQKLLEIARIHRIPVIADEIYENIVFPPRQFVSMASIDSGVPILLCGGLAKRFLVPGWRLGWIYIHDPIDAFQPEIRKGLICLSQKIMGSNTLIQGALPKILKNTPQSFYDNLVQILEQNALAVFRGLQNVKGLTPYMPQGTMYMMVELHLELFPCFKTGLEFVERLMEEESVLCLPGECFFQPGFVRLVITAPRELLLEACSRMEEFCSRYYLLKLTI